MKATNFSINLESATREELQTALVHAFELIAIMKQEILELREEIAHLRAAISSNDWDMENSCCKCYFCALSAFNITLPLRITSQLMKDPNRAHSNL